MTKRGPAWRVKWDLDNPVISIRVNREEYGDLLAFRDEEGTTFKAMLKSTLLEKEPSSMIQVGSCPVCGSGYMVDLDDPVIKDWLEREMRKAMPMCEGCREKRG